MVQRVQGLNLFDGKRSVAVPGPPEPVALPKYKQAEPWFLAFSGKQPKREVFEYMHGVGHGSTKHGFPGQMSISDASVPAGSDIMGWKMLAAGADVPECAGPATAIGPSTGGESLMADNPMLAASVRSAVRNGVRDGTAAAALSRNTARKENETGAGAKEPVRCVPGWDYDHTTGRCAYAPNYEAITKYYTAKAASPGGFYSDMEKPMPDRITI